MSSAERSRYDEIPYDSRPRYATHPDCLATLATLLGMSPAPVERCRVLELGCATGGNLLPLAEAFPESRFVGIDLSERQIETGRQVVQALGLKNLQLERRSILEVDASYGEFDYLLAHGVYSWVPEEVREKLLAICRANLATQGVAYISYNTYPGWYLRAGVRDLMRFHVRGLKEPVEMVQQSRAIVDFVLKQSAHPDSTWAKVLHDEAELIRPEGDYYVLHEHLETESHPVYFLQFLEHARRHGLQFLGEAMHHTNLSTFSASAQETLQRIAGDLLELEQYVDFLKNRSFRRTLLVHQEVPLNRKQGPEVVEKLLVVGLVKPVSAHPEIHSNKIEEFVNEDGVIVSTAAPFAKAALVLLYENWPRAFTVEELWQAVRGYLEAMNRGMSEKQGRAFLCGSLVHLYLSNLVSLHVHLAAYATTAGDRPRTTPLIRLQARSGAHITNRRHKRVELSALERAILSQCDGEKDRGTMVELLTENVLAGELELRQQSEPMHDREAIRHVLREQISPALERLAQAMLLVE